MSQRDKDSLPPDVIEAFVEALRPLEPDAERRGVMKRRLLSRIRDDVAAGERGITTIRGGEGEWAALAPGVWSKELFDDGASRTWLARLEREARVAEHFHFGNEECLVLEGSVVLAGVLMKAGDYQIARAGSAHDEVYSPTGCLLLVRSASRPIAELA